MGISEVPGIQMERGSSPPPPPPLCVPLRAIWEAEKLAHLSSSHFLPRTAISAFPALPHRPQTTHPTLPPSFPSVPHSRLFGLQRNALCAKQTESSSISTKPYYTANGLLLSGGASAGLGEPSSVPTTLRRCASLSFPVHVGPGKALESPPTRWRCLWLPPRGRSGLWWERPGRQAGNSVRDGDRNEPSVQPWRGQRKPETPAPPPPQALVLAPTPEGPPPGGALGSPSAKAHRTVPVSVWGRGRRRLGRRKARRNEAEGSEDGRRRGISQ